MAFAAAVTGTLLLLAATPLAYAQAPGSLDALNANVAGGVYVLATAMQPDGKTIIGGQFSSVLGVSRNNIARLNANGTLDTGFDPKTNNNILGVVVQKDGKILICGNFTTLQPNGAASATTRQNVARLNPNGSLDTAFDPKPGGSSPWVNCVAVQVDGKILLGGSFTTLGAGGTARSRIARVNADGSLDMGFNPNANGSVHSLAVQEDGKILFGGGFTAVGATTRNRIARVNADGSLDTDFDPKADNNVNSVAVQADGKILLGGQFTLLQPNGANGTARNRIARVNADGSLDMGFNPNATGGGPDSVAVQADGKILLGGGFTMLQPNGAGSGTERNRIARMNADGSLDTGFDPKANANVNSVAVQTDGKILLGGSFTTLQPNGAASATVRNFFARLNNDTATQTLSAPHTTQVLWQRGGASPEISQVTFEKSIDGGANWTPLGSGIRMGITSNWQLTGLALPSSFQLRARGRTAHGNGNSSSGLEETVVSYGPDITVDQPLGRALGDGTSSIVFGALNVGSSGSTKTFTISNPGTMDLTGLAVSKDGTNAADFSVSVLGDTSVPVGSNTITFTVTFSPSASGPRNAAIHVTSNVNGAKNPFDINLTGVGLNNAPTTSDIADTSTNEDIATSALPLIIGDVETEAASLTMSGTSSNTLFVPTANIVFGGSGANRTVTVTPAANQNGSATITVTVSDGTATTSDTFVLTINAVNDPPTLTDITDQTINEDANTGARAFTIGDMETSAASLILTRSSSNTALVPDENIVLGGSGANRTVTTTPLANQFGTTTVTITASDGELTTSDTFLLTVNSMNDLPTISDITNQTIDEDAATGTLSFIVGDVETAAVSLTVTGNSSNPTLVPSGNMAFSGSGASRSVVVTPAANQFGTATITITVSDGTGPRSDTFLLTVNSVNDAPTISDIAESSTNEDTATSALPFTIGDVETAAISLTVGGTSSNMALVPIANIVIGGSGANRTVSVAPAANQNGSATITVTVSDGTTSTSDTFVLTVNPINDAPIISNITDQNINANTLTNSLPFTVGDLESPAASLTVNGTSSNPMLVPDGNIFFGGNGPNRTVTVIPESNQIGSTTITVSVSDGLLAGSGTFVVNVFGPEIAVEQPFNTNIANGGSKSFGNVAVGTTTSLVFYIKNTGNANLTGLGLTKDGYDAAMFTITANPTAPVSSPNGTTAFTVRFAPASAGLKTASIHIANNDSDENPFDITLTGTGVIPITDWRQTHFGNTASSGDGANLNDYDHDGFPNLVEYAFGLNPEQNSAGGIPQAQIVGGNFVLNFMETAGVIGIMYGAEWSATMEANDWHAIPDSGTPPQHTFSVPIGTAKRGFIRHKVSSQ